MLLTMGPKAYTDLLKASIEKHGGRACMHIKRNGAYRSWTFNDFRRDLNALASGLKRAGFPKGGHGIVIGENTPEWVLSYHAIVLSGGCAVPVDPNLPDAEIREIVKQVRPGAVFCSGTFASFFEELLAGGLIQCPPFSLPGEKEEGACGYAALKASGNADEDAFSLSFGPEDPIAVIFTSGTTGRAKGAVLLQRNFTSASLHGVPRMRVTPEDVMMAVLPLHHVFGFAACVAATLCSGVAVVHIPAMKGPVIVEGIREKQVTILPSVPQMLEIFYDNIERKVREKGPAVAAVFFILKILSAVLGPLFGTGFRRRLFSAVHEGFGGKLSLVISGGASIKKKYFNGFRRMGFTIVEGYGLTETFGPITLCPCGDGRPGSVGPVLPGNEMEIRAPDKAGRGEVCFRGETVFSGYFRNPEGTAAVFDSQGWFHTGDLGRVARDGFLYLTGRIKDVIVLSSGKNVYPEELEEYYSSCPEIEEIGVFGIRCKGEEIVAAVAYPSREVRHRYPQEEARERTIRSINEMGKRLPTYKKIADCEVSVHPLPRTTTRKIKKSELREIYLSLKNVTGRIGKGVESLTLRERELMKSESFAGLSKILRSLSRGKGVSLTLQSHLEYDLGLDSLRRLEMISLLEKEFGLSLPGSALERLETAGDALKLVMEGVTAAPGAPGTVLGRKRRVIKESTSLIYRLAPLAARSFSRLCWSERVLGTDLLPEKGPLVFASNHESSLDIWWILCGLPWKIRRSTFTVGKAELASFPGAGALLRNLNMIAMTREGDFQEALDVSLDILRSGRNLAIFPEGTRTRTGRMGRFKSGVGRLMLDSGASAVPVRIKGSFELWAPGKGPALVGKRHVRPTVTFGKAISLEEMVKSGVRREAESIAAHLQEIISGM